MKRVRCIALRWRSLALALCTLRLAEPAAEPGREVIRILVISGERVFGLVRCIALRMHPTVGRTCC
jgi:hypothetical protein